VRSVCDNCLSAIGHSLYWGIVLCLMHMLSISLFLFLLILRVAKKEVCARSCAAALHQKVSPICSYYHLLFHRYIS
jgi:hypothetical protein